MSHTTWHGLAERLSQLKNIRSIYSIQRKKPPSIVHFRIRRQWFINTLDVISLVKILVDLKPRIAIFRLLDSSPLWRSVSLSESNTCQVDQKIRQMLRKVWIKQILFILFYILFNYWFFTCWLHFMPRRFSYFSAAAMFTGIYTNGKTIKNNNTVK